MSQTDLQHIILNHYDNLSVAERKVADYIWGQLELVSGYSIRELAKVVGVSSGTITNFCKSIGFDGFSSLQLAITRELAYKSSKLQKDLPPYLNLLIHTIEASARSIDPKEFEKATKILADASSVVLFGGGSSGKVGHLAAEILIYFGKLAYSFDQLSTLRAAAEYVNEETAVIVISHRGKEKNVVETLKRCRSKGGKTICITNYGSSPLTSECEAVIQTSIRTLDPELELMVQPVREIQMAVLHMLVLKALGKENLFEREGGEAFNN